MVFKDCLIYHTRLGVRMPAHLDHKSRPGWGSLLFVASRSLQDPNPHWQPGPAKDSIDRKMLAAGRKWQLFGSHIDTWN